MGCDPDLAIQQRPRLHHLAYDLPLPSVTSVRRSLFDLPESYPEENGALGLRPHYQERREYFHQCLYLGGFPSLPGHFCDTKVVFHQDVGRDGYRQVLAPHTTVPD